MYKAPALSPGCKDEFELLHSVHSVSARAAGGAAAGSAARTAAARGARAAARREASGDVIVTPTDVGDDTPTPPGADRGTDFASDGWGL
jgi:hypothetical protein